MVNMWSVISLFVEEYHELDKERTKMVVRSTIPRLEAKSMVRAFLLRVAFN